MTYLVFDEAMDYQFGGHISTTDAAPLTMAQYVINDIEITKPGYIYVYLNNESTSQDHAFFDDLEVEISRVVVQCDDYYPGGLTYNSYNRTASTAQNYKFTGKERIPELGLDDFGARL